DLPKKHLESVRHVSEHLSGMYPGFTLEPGIHGSV
ncbi:UNVERIFIED_ORG: hypothetical protein GGI66_006371, partial [Rhizobium esperanzae]